MNEQFLKRMENLLGDQYPAFIQSLQQEPVKGFYLNPLKEHVIEHLDSRFIQSHPYIPHGYYFDYHHYPLGKSPYFMCGLYYIQEPSAMTVASLVDVKEDDYILDMCGAPGGKTCYLASQLGKDGLMIANDIHKIRAQILSSNIERFGLTNTIVTQCDPLRFSFQSFFDKIILDAPCSGEGMFRKDEESIDTWSMQKVNECAYIQRQLLDKAYTMLKRDGLLIYSTCTYSLEENEQQVQYMIETYDMELIPIEKQPGMSDGVDLKGTVRMYPHLNQGEGQFIAILKKKNDTEKRLEKPLKANIKPEQKQLVKSFYQTYLNIDMPPYLYANQDHIYAIQPQFVDVSPIRVMRQGLYLGQCKKGRFEPSLSLCLTLKKQDVKNMYTYHENDQEIHDYLKGLTLKGTSKKGYGVIFVDDYPLSFYKESNGQVKNLYPKGLRR